MAAGLQTQKKRDEKEGGREGGGTLCTKTRHCVAQLAARDEEEKYPEGEIQGWRTRRRRVVANETETETETQRENKVESEVGVGR